MVARGRNRTTRYVSPVGAVFHWMDYVGTTSEAAVTRVLARTRDSGSVRKRRRTQKCRATIKEAAIDSAKTANSRHLRKLITPTDICRSEDEDIVAKEDAHFDPPTI